MTLNIPNSLTLSRIILVPIFMLLLLWEFPWHYFVALAVFVIASLTDMFDGMIARKKNLVTVTGKFLDPIADKMLTTSAFLGFIYLNIGWGTVWVTLIILLREFFVSSLRMISAEKGTVIAADMFGKLKTVSQMAAIIVTLIIKWAWQDIITVYFKGAWISTAHLWMDNIITVLLWFCAVMTILSGINYLKKNLDFLN